MAAFEKSSVFTVTILVGLTIFVPQFAGLYQIIQYSNFAIMAIFALSLGWIWGFGGLLCFGQSAFFGLGAYIYAIIAINTGESTTSFLVAIILPAVFAIFLGGLMFYGRVSNIYFAVITLCVTLILYGLIASTAGPQYRIFAAHLNGQNGISSFPTLSVPGNPDAKLGIEGMYYLAMSLLTLCYLGLRLVLASRHGRIAVAVRENEGRAELQGYDTRFVKTWVFALGGAIAGVAGALFANWSAFINPDVFGLQTAALVLMWVIVGGLGTLSGPMLGAALIQLLANVLGKQQFANTSLVFGAILIVFVLVVPQGILPSVRLLWGKLQPFNFADVRRMGKRFARQMIRTGTSRG